MSQALDRLKNLANKISSYEITRKENLVRLEELFIELHIDEKVGEFRDIFEFKAENLTGISLSKESLGEISADKYLQILAISYDKDAKVKSKNVSLGYFGKVGRVDEKLRAKIVEFVIRFRFEKSFMTLESYFQMLEIIKKGSR
ncbi:MAG: hypothetical protein RBS91_02305 [Sulfurimonadaceae bacterium]|jgi:hypothetical protein|nr:hypothetical protein [Sulfurimonadaceae bacterium]